MNHYLAGDIGGTNCRYALFDGNKLSHIQTWSTQQSSGLRDDMERYLAGFDIVPTAACIAIACPVVGDEVVLTNADWRGRTSDLPCKGSIINDLEAAAHGLRQTESTPRQNRDDTKTTLKHSATKSDNTESNERQSETQ